MAGAILLLTAVPAGCNRDSGGGGGVPPAKQETPASQPAAPSFSGSGASFAYPLRLKVTDSGWLLVSDPKLKTVFRVDPRTLLADRAIRFADKPLAVGMHGVQIFVGLEGAQAIETYSTSGDQTGYLAPPGSIGYPADLAIDGAAGLAFVLDGLAREVRVIRIADAEPAGSFGQKSLLAPVGVTVDPPRQEVLVSDYGDPGKKASLRIFSYAPATFGKKVDLISGKGTCGGMMGGCTGGFSRPRGLAVHNDRIYLADALLGQVLIFDRTTLAKVGELGNPDPAARDLRVPSDVSITPTGDVYVTSSLAGTVVAYPGGAP